MRLTREQKQEKAVEDLINQMFIIAGHDVRFEDIKTRQDNWFQQYTMTMAQNDEWKEWGKKYLQTNLRERAKSAESSNENGLCNGLVCNNEVIVWIKIQ
jgi:hypothetical protein